MDNGVSSQRTAIIYTWKCREKLLCTVYNPVSFFWWFVLGQVQSKRLLAKAVATCSWLVWKFFVMDVIQITSRRHQAGRWLGAGRHITKFRSRCWAGDPGRNIIQKSLTLFVPSERSTFRNNIYNGIPTQAPESFPTHRKCRSRGSCLQSYLVFAYPKCSEETCKKASLFLATIILRFSTRLAAFYHLTPI